MSYRHNHLKNLNISDTTTPSSITIENGVSSDFAFSCWYSKEHRHDCNHNEKNLSPIHLTEEGYTRVEVIFDDQPVGLVATAYIDEEEDWVIRLELNAQLDEAIEQRFRCRYTILIHMEVDNVITKTDMVCKGKLTVLPSPWKSGD